MYSLTTATKKVSSLKKKIRAAQGGTSASKTISILLVLIDLAQRDTKPTLTSVVAESVPHLKRGAMRDFKNIMVEHHYWKDSRWNATDSIYTFETGSQIEFFSADQPDKLRGARRDRLFINESNNITLEAFDQLEVRTKEFVYLDWNPTNEFWFYTDILPTRSDVDHIILTYKDNEALSQEIINSIEQRRNRAGWWKVYGEGQLGEVEGRIYTGWQEIDSIPHEARLERYGLDFGWSPDPVAIVAVYYYNGGYILDQVAYQLEMSNREIAETLKNLPKALVVADSAEPKSIAEIKMYGINIVPTNKGADSIRHGIKTVQDQKISVTRQSYDLLKEYKNYLWAVDKEGRLIAGVPEGGKDHCFAPETIVKTTKGDIKISELVGETGFLYSRGGKIKRFSHVRPTRENVEVLDIEFNDSTKISVTEDHLLLRPDGIWQEAGLFIPTDMIQSDMYEDNSIFQWKKIYSPQWREIFKQWERAYAQVRLGVLPWGNTEGNAYSSQGRGPNEQRYSESRDEVSSSSSKRTYDTREATESEGMGRSDTSPNKEVAWVKRGDRVAQVTWEENMGEKRNIRERMHALPYEIYNSTFRVIKVLWLKLQNESQAKEIKRITRRFCPVTYNLEVEDTHCLSVSGVIAHNCLDAVRYSMSSLIPIIRRREMVPPMKQTLHRKSNIAL